MKGIDLFFYGYSWEGYCGIFSNKPGILVVYRGKLDREGLIKMNEIVFVAGANKICDIIDSEQLKIIRKCLAPGERLFYSYAEMAEDGREEIVALLNISFNIKDVKGINEPILLSCKGACALFPKELLIEEQS